jgi:hypothetical protein
MAETGPARTLAVLGVVGNLAATTMMHRRMDPVEAEPLRQGTPGRMLRWSRALTIAGGAGALLGGRRRSLAVVSGLSLLTASALTRFGGVRRGHGVRSRSALHNRAAEAPPRRPPRGRPHRRFDHHRLSKAYDDYATEGAGNGRAIV